MSPLVPEPASGQPAGERTVRVVKPARRSVVLRSLRTLAIVLVVAGGAAWVAHATGRAQFMQWIWLAAAGVVLLRLIWEVLVRWSRTYTLTTERVIAASGVLERRIIDVPHERVQHAIVHRTILERLFGLGTLGVATAGTGTIDLFWIMIANPMQRLDDVRTRTDADESADASKRSARVPVIGLAGGIGAGKSRIADELQRLGCLVIDSDREARAVLEREEVKRELVRWWGSDVVGEDGNVSRSRIAEIVFEDPTQRTRLEALVHPLVKRSRDELIEASRGHRAVVIDAPLLFEAELDADCDAVIFVDAPREVRLARVVEHRGWTEAELDRRERAQLPIDEKRRRSDHVIDNGRDDRELSTQTAEVLEAIESALARDQRG